MPGHVGIALHRPTGLDPGQSQSREETAPRGSSGALLCSPELLPPPAAPRDEARYNWERPGSPPDGSWGPAPSLGAGCCERGQQLCSPLRQILSRASRSPNDSISVAGTGSGSQEKQLGSELPQEVHKNSLPQNGESVLAEGSQVTVRHRWGPGVFPPEAGPGDALEMKSQGWGRGARQEQGQRDCSEGWRQKPPLAVPPLEAGTTVRWLQGPETTAGTPAAPLPPTLMAERPAPHRNLPVQGLLCSTSGEGPSPTEPPSTQGQKP